MWTEITVWLLVTGCKAERKLISGLADAGGICNCNTALKWMWQPPEISWSALELMATGRGWKMYTQPLQKDLSIQFLKSEMLKRWEKRMRKISVRSVAFVSALWHSCMCFPSAVWKIYSLSSHVNVRPVLSGLQEEGIMQILAGKQHECCWAEESSREERVANQSSELVHGILHLEIQQIRLVNTHKIKIKN